MKTIISSSEIVGQFNQNEGEFEVCATAEGQFDEAKSQLIVALDSFVRPIDLRTKERHVAADWLPPREQITESVGLDEARELARVLFHRWVGRVRQAVPVPLHM